MPNVNGPTLSIITERFGPRRTLKDARGGFQFRTSSPFPGIGDISLGVAHYWTYFDNPSVRIMSQNFPLPITDPSNGQGFPIWAQQVAPRVGVTGIFGNFALPPEWVRPLGLSGEPIIRFEVAHFNNEPRNTQSTNDPFIFSLYNCPGGKFADANGTVNPRSDEWRHPGVSVLYGWCPHRGLLERRIRPRPATVAPLAQPECQLLHFDAVLLQAPAQR